MNKRKAIKSSMLIVTSESNGMNLAMYAKNKATAEPNHKAITHFVNIFITRSICCFLINGSK